MPDARSNEFVPRCAMPWQQMVIDSTGAVAPCCYWGAYDNQNAPIGDLGKQTLEEIWNGEGYQKLRAGMASGDLAAAGCAKCYALKQRMDLAMERDPDCEDDFETPHASNMRILRQEMADGATVLKAKPTILSYTPSHRCNIRCTHCYQESTRTAELSRTAAEEEITRLAPYLVRLIAGGGEPFLLSVWRKFLKRHVRAENPYLTFSTSTNATILTDEIAEQLAKFKNLTLNVSIDGVKGAFERVRVGATFGEVERNVRRLQTIAAQAPSGKGYVGASMCVMKSNILGLADFIRWTAELGIAHGLSPVISMPPDESLRCFNRHPRDEMMGWSDAVDSAVSALEDYWPTYARLGSFDALPQHMIDARRDYVRAIKDVIPFKLADTYHRHVVIPIAPETVEGFRLRYGAQLVAYIFHADRRSPAASYWSWVVNDAIDVYLPPGKYAINMATKWAPAEFWDQVIFEVVDDRYEPGPVTSTDDGSRGMPTPALSQAEDEDSAPSVSSATRDDHVHGGIFARSFRRLASLMALSSRG